MWDFSIGEATATAFANESAKVVLTGCREEEGRNVVDAIKLADDKLLLN